MKNTTAKQIRKACQDANEFITNALSQRSLESKDNTTLAVFEALSDRAECIAKLLKKIP